jgi:hypothetical protein
LLESCPHPEARELLRAGIADSPRPAAARATALALGLGAGLGITIAASAAGATVAASSYTATSALVVGKWLALGTLAGVALAGGASVLTSPSASPREAAPAVRTNPQPSLPAAPRDAQSSKRPAPDEAPATPARVETAPLGSPPPLPASARQHSDLPNSASLPDGHDLGREVAQIDAARRAVAGGNGRAALHHLDQYSALDRTSTLDREAQLLRIDASLLVGSKDEALRLARAYLAEHAGDPHSARLRALLENP